MTYIKGNDRKARIHHSPVNKDKWNVVKHTMYQNHWYYVGQAQFDTQEEAERFAEDWVSHGRTGDDR